MLIHFLGLLAAITSTISLFPQIVKTYRSQSAKDLSFWMLVNFLLTSVLWCGYGILTHSWAVWVTNLIMVISAVILLFFKYRFE